MKTFSFIFFLLISTKLFSQDSLTVEQAIKYAVDHNYGVVISRNEIEIGKLNNNWANAGAYPTVSATANKTIASSNNQQNLNNGTVPNQKGTTVQT